MLFSKPAVTDVSPAELHAALEADKVLLIDVREPGEYAAERIHGALLFPLSSFDPHALPGDAERMVVLQCGSGKRSAMAAQRCKEAGVKVSHHLAGGIMAWKAAGYPTVTFDPNTGDTVDRR